MMEMIWMFSSLLMDEIPTGHETFTSEHKSTLGRLPLMDYVYDIY